MGQKLAYVTKISIVLPISNHPVLGAIFARRPKITRPNKVHFIF